jgi:hypothetical protein
MRSWVHRSTVVATSRRSGAREDASGGSTALEGVVVLGMHRSGTSLVTRLVNLLGLAVCREQDLLVGHKANARGHWESRSLLDLNDRLLDELGGAWFCPPPVGPEQLSRLLDRHGSEALAMLRHAHPQRPWVWKDPRTCLLLPFWSAILPRRTAYVLVVRHPLEVSDSLVRRDGFAPSLSLALWERYNRQAMLGAAGRPMMVCTYDEVLNDPVDWCERLVAFLREVGSSALAVDRTVAGGFATHGLRNSEQSWTQLRPGPLISAQQAALAAAASVPTTHTSYLPPELPAETPDTEAIFREIREPDMKRSARPRHPADLPSHLHSRGVARRGGQDPEPPVSVLLARFGPGTRASLPALAATLPAGSEILVIGDECAIAGDLDGLDAISIRCIDGDRPPREAEALALGAQAARGRIVLVTTAGLSGCDQWYASFERALAPRGVAGLAPVLRLHSSPRRRYFGRAFTDQDLAVRLVPRRRASAPVPAALLFAAHCVFDRTVLVAAGGVDKDFGSADAAVAELSVRLWRMGFRCCIVPQVEAWGGDAGEVDGEDDAERLYDRFRIAALHFDAARLRAFTDHARQLASYEQVVERLAASDIKRRRAAIAAVCAFPIDRYFDSFPLTN